MQRYKENIAMTLVSIITLVFGFWFIFADASHIKSVVFVTIGITLIILSLYKLNAIRTRKTNQNMIKPFITIVIGVVLILCSDFADWLFVLCGIYILVEPLFNIFTSANRRVQLKFEAPKIFLGACLLLLYFDVMYKVLFVIVGVGLIISAIFSLYSIGSGKEIMLVTPNKKTKKDIIDAEE